MPAELKMTNNQDGWMSAALKLEVENKGLRGEVERLKTELEFTELRLNAALNGDMLIRFRHTGTKCRP